MDVPSLMRCVRKAAAAKIVMLSGRAPPVVIQAACTPSCSARSMRGQNVMGIVPTGGKADQLLWHVSFLLCGIAKNVS